MAILKMSADKRLILEEENLLFRGERNVDRVTVFAPRYYEGMDLSQMQMRICFSLSKWGEYAVLSPTLVEEGLMRDTYVLPERLFAQAGVYAVWLEFWSQGVEPLRMLYTDAAALTVLAHPQAQTLVGERELNYLEQYHAEMEDYRYDNAAHAAQMQTLCARAEESVAQAQAARQAAQDTLSSCVKHGDSRIPMSESMSLQAVGGGLLVQPYPDGADGNNAVAQQLTFTFGYKNHNGGWASFAGGVSNRTSQSQQFVMGSGNSLPSSKNMAAVGQYCSNLMENAQGQTLLDSESAKRPLFAVGNGTGANARSNALTVYGDGEAVLQYEGERILLAKTAKEHAARLDELQAKYEGLTLQTGDCVRGALVLRDLVTNVETQGTGSAQSTLSHDSVTWALSAQLASLHDMGRRVRAIHLTYVAYPALGEGVSLSFPYDSKNTMGGLTLRAVGIEGVSIEQDGLGTCAMCISPAAFGAERWFVETPDGVGAIYYTLELA